MDINLDQIRALAELAADRNLAELTIEQGETKINIRMPVDVQPTPPSSIIYGAMPQGMMSQPQTAPSASVVSNGTVEEASFQPSQGAGAAASAGDNPNLHTITSPMVGTFYSSPSPDSDAFVKVGSSVSAGQTLCIIEAMKLMNELEAEVGGKIVEILVKNAEPVEFGQPLFKIDPQG